MTQVCYGPLWRIDGPPPAPPTYTLLGASRVVDDLDAAQVERWIGGVALYPFPADSAIVMDAGATGSDRIKQEGGAVGFPEFGAMTVYFAETCSSYGIFGAGLSNEQAQARFVARAQTAFNAVESAAIESEFMLGTVLGLNPHLADGNGSFPWGDTPTSVENGFAVLENEIGLSGRAGMLHVSPALLTASSYRVWITPDRNGVLRTIAGTPVVPGYGYAAGSTPAGGHDAPGPSEDWAYATGPIEIRRSPTTLLPGTLTEALNRETNTITYRIERFYMVEWDTVVQSAVLIDRCVRDCGTPSS